MILKFYNKLLCSSITLMLNLAIFCKMFAIIDEWTDVKRLFCNKDTVCVGKKRIWKFIQYTDI